MEMNDNPAIVFVKASQVKTDPNLRSQDAFELHERNEGSNIRRLREELD